MPEMPGDAADKGCVEHADWRGLHRRSHGPSRRSVYSSLVGPPSRTDRKRTMSGLDRLYRFEIETHRLFRAEDVNAGESVGVHTSFAPQNPYEPLLRTNGAVNPADLVRATGRVMGTGDPRDVQAASHSLRQLVRIA
jgi:hypothetical protein